MRYLNRFTSEEAKAFRVYLCTEDLLERERKRFTAIYLSSQHQMSMNEISQTCEVDVNSVQNWFNSYESQGFAGLLDKNMSHKKSYLSQQDEATILASVKNNPQNLQIAVSELSEYHHITTNKRNLQGYLKKKKWTWRRVQKSLKSQRDSVLFDFFKGEIAMMEQSKAEENIAVWYADEVAFHKNPNSMYAWQEPMTTQEHGITLPAERGNLLNVLGFMDRELKTHFYEFEKAMNQLTFIEAIEEFINTHVTQKTILIIDKSSTHTGAKVKEKLTEWANKNLMIQFLPTASSELNIIEMLWKAIKHRWIAVADWITKEKLVEKVRYILKNIGTEYKIQFQT